MKPWSVLAILIIAISTAAQDPAASSKPQAVSAPAHPTDPGVDPATPAPYPADQAAELAKLQRDVVLEDNQMASLQSQFRELAVKHLSDSKTIETKFSEANAKLPPGWTLDPHTLSYCKIGPNCTPAQFPGQASPAPPITSPQKLAPPAKK